MLFTIRSIAELWQGIGGGLVLIAVLLGGSNLYELKTFTAAPVEQSQTVEGVLEIRAKTLSIRGATGVIHTCPSGWCGYPSMKLDYGEQRSFWLSEGRIIQVARNGQIIDTREEVQTRQQRWVWFAAVALVAGVCLLVFGSHRRRRAAIGQ